MARRVDDDLRMGALSKTSLYYSPQWLINLGQAKLEKDRRGPSLCKACHKNPAEWSGYCGDCFNRLKEADKVPVRRRWFVALSHFFE
jgi:hypothetical protein